MIKTTSTHCMYATPTIIICQKGEMFRDRRNGKNTQNEANITLSLFGPGFVVLSSQTNSFFRCGKYFKIAR